MPHPPTALIAVVIAALASGTATPQDADKTAPTVEQVMTTMTVPASDAIFAAASEPPKDDAQWVALRASTGTLDESARLLLKTGPAKNDAEWIEMARALATEAEVIMKAIDAKDAERIAQAGDDMYLTCKACHDRFDP
jgi:cytochrome c556